MSKRKIAVLSLAFVAVVGVALSVTDLGTGVVRDQAIKALTQTLQAKVSLGEISGNPLKGYALKELSLVKDGEYSLDLPSLEVKPNLLALLRGGAVVDRVILSGISTDLDQLTALVNGLPKSDASGPPSVPVGSVSVVKSSLGLPGGILEIKDISARFKDDRGLAFDLGLDVAYGGVPAKGAVSGLYGGSFLTLRDLDMSVGSGKVKAQGDVFPDLAAKGEVRDLNLAELAGLWPDLAGASFSGKVSMAFDVGGTLESPVVNGSVGFDGVLAAIPVSGLAGNFAYQDMALDLPDLKAVVAGVPLAGALSSRFGEERPIIDLKMDASDADLDRLRASYPQIPKELSGVVQSLSVALEGPVDKLKGTVKARAESLKVMGYGLSQSWASVALTPDGKASVSAKTVFQGQPAYLEGGISFGKGAPEAKLLFKVRKVPTDLIASMLSGPLPVSGLIDMDLSIKGNLAEPSITGTVSAPSLSGFEQVLNDPTVKFVLRGTDLDIPSAHASWRGAPLAVSGKLSMGGKAPSGSFKGEMKGLDLSALSDLAPGLVGRTDADFSLDGDLSDPSMQLGIKSSKVAMSQISLEKVDLQLKGKAASMALLGSASVAGGSLAASGSLGLGESPVVDLSVKGDGIGIAKLVDLPLSGALSAVLTAKGSVAEPNLTLNLSLPKGVAWGVGIDGLAASVEGKGKAFTLKEGKASVGGSPFTVSGSFDGASSKGEFSLSGTDLDLTKASQGLPEAQSYGIGGKVSVSFKGALDGKAMTGSGSIKAPVLSVMNISLNNVSYPIEIKGNRLTVSSASAELYGGSVTGSGWVDLDSLKFSKKVSVSGTDVAPLIRAFAGTDGTVTGIGKAQFEGSGVLSPFSFKGNGTAELGGGQVVGFPLAQVAASLHGTDGIRYRSANGTFHLVNDVFTLDKASVQAHDGDPIYRSFVSSGVIGPNRKLALDCAGEVNMRLLNAVVGAGVGGVLGGGAGTIAAIIGGALGGAQQGISKDDFRDISFQVVGTLDSSSVKGLKVGPSKIEPAPAQEAPAASITPPSSVPSQPVPQEEPKNLEDQLKDALEQEAGKVLQNILGGGN
ncbi:MAG: AsmA-like C-terminal region-containing protein [Dethiosulfovibrio sp.]|nr:AsmA-like C-terminal region-containing protein [Dethiosulfovibrio sp.]